MPLHVSIDAAFCIASNQDMNQLNGSNDTCSLRISHSDKVNVENRRGFDSTELKSERGTAITAPDRTGGKRNEIHFAHRARCARDTPAYISVRDYYAITSR